MCRTIVVSIFLSTSLFCFSQEETQQKLESTEVVIPKLEVETPAVAEATPSLEEQGFKPVLVNEKLVYRKEINGFIVEFIPESH